MLLSPTFYISHFFHSPFGAITWSVGNSHFKYLCRVWSSFVAVPKKPIITQRYCDWSEIDFSKEQSTPSLNSWTNSWVWLIANTACSRKIKWISCGQQFASLNIKALLISIRTIYYFFFTCSSFLQWRMLWMFNKWVITLKSKMLNEFISAASVRI